MRPKRQRSEIEGFESIDRWYQSDVGEYLLDELESQLAPLLTTTFGYYSLQIGCPGLARKLHSSCRIKHCFTLDNESSAQVKVVPSMLPIASDSVDLVLLMHHLSDTDEPHAVLREAFRVLIPEGKLIIIDFNPVSLWGLRHFVQSWLERVPFRGHYYTPRRIDDWMRLLGFDRHSHHRVGYLPPIQKLSIARRLIWLEKGMKRWLPGASVLNMMVYKKSVSPLTPMRHRWVMRKLLPAKVARSGVGCRVRHHPNL